MKSKRNFRGSYLSYIITFFLMSFGSGMFSQVLSIYLVGIGKTNSEMAFVVSSANLFGLVLIPVFGFINDRFKKPHLIIAAMAISALLSLVFSGVSNTWSLYLLHGCIMGLISALNPIFENLATDGKYRYGQIRIWGTIGYAVSSQVGTILMDITDPKWIFVLFAASILLAAVGFFYTGVISYRPQQKKLPPIQQIAFLKNPMFLLVVLVGALFSAVVNMNITFVPLYLKSLGMTTSFVGTALLLSTLMEVPLVYFSYKFMDKFPAKFIAAFSFGLMFTEFVIFSRTSSAAVAFIAILLLKATGSQLFFMTLIKLVRDIVEENAVYTAMGVVSTVNAISTIIMQNVGGKLTEVMGMHGLYVVLAGLSALAVILCLLLKVNNKVTVFS
jgi:OHS family lactose permease-like MFS transporter